MTDEQRIQGAIEIVKPIAYQYCEDEDKVQEALKPLVDLATEYLKVRNEMPEKYSCVGELGTPAKWFNEAVEACTLSALKQKRELEKKIKVLKEELDQVKYHNECMKDREFNAMADKYTKMEVKVNELQAKVKELESNQAQGEAVTVDELRGFLCGEGQITSKYPSKQKLLAGEETFIPAEQYEDVAKSILSTYKVSKKEEDEQS